LAFAAIFGTSVCCVNIQLIENKGAGIMKNRAAKLAVILIAAAGLLAAYYLPKSISPASAQAQTKGAAAKKAITLEEARQMFKAAFPDAEFKNFTKGPTPSLYEVQIDNERIIYYNPEEGVALVGDLYRNQQENLTQKRRSELAAEIFSKIDLQTALKIGNGPKVIYEVTDPDCPYCRRGSTYLDQRQDVTRYIFFYPLASHPEAPEKIRFIFSSPDPVKAYHDVMNGVYDKDRGGKPLPAFTDKGSARLQEHLKIAGMLGVRGTPAYWINGQPVSGANIQLIEQLLK
jgi:thiol:disulfide interchange protein DsbC